MPSANDEPTQGETKPSRAQAHGAASLLNNDQFLPTAALHHQPTASTTNTSTRTPSS